MKEEKYQKAYALLVGKIDDVLAIMDTGDLLKYDHIRGILEEALLDAEEIFVGAEEQ